MRHLSDFITESINDEAKIQKEAKKLFKKLSSAKFPKWQSAKTKQIYSGSDFDMKLNQHLCDSLNKMGAEKGVDYISVRLFPEDYGNWDDNEILNWFGEIDVKSGFNKIYHKDGLYAGIEKMSITHNDIKLYRLWMWYSW